MSETQELKKGECGGQSCPDAYESILGTPGSPSTERDYFHLKTLWHEQKPNYNAGGGRRVIRSTRYLA